jgi:uncharacterized protein (DUF2252 family)
VVGRLAVLDRFNPHERGFLVVLLLDGGARTLNPESARHLSVSAWVAELQRNWSKSLDAPSWLWNSVLELVAAHEAAYLQHCRRYALSDAA